MVPLWVTPKIRAFFALRLAHNHTIGTIRSVENRDSPSRTRSNSIGHREPRGRLDCVTLCDNEAPHRLPCPPPRRRRRLPGRPAPHPARLHEPRHRQGRGEGVREAGEGLRQQARRGPGIRQARQVQVPGRHLQQGARDARRRPPRREGLHARKHPAGHERLRRRARAGPRGRVRGHLRDQLQPRRPVRLPLRWQHRMGGHVRPRPRRRILPHHPRPPRGHHQGGADRQGRAVGHRPRRQLLRIGHRCLQLPPGHHGRIGRHQPAHPAVLRLPAGRGPGAHPPLREAARAGRGSDARAPLRAVRLPGGHGHGHREHREGQHQEGAGRPGRHPDQHQPGYVGLLPPPAIRLLRREWQPRREHAALLEVNS
ncbi:hypothetical protein ACHAWF_017364 [Thalassiosira exigua]